MAEAFGRYELLKRIAGGGMGEVFLARQSGMEGFEKYIVVKTLLPNLAEDEEFVGMFLDEARLAARLNHPNVCQIYDLGDVGGVLYMAMEFIQGEDLLRIHKTASTAKKEFPVALVARSIADAAAGLHHAHQLADKDGKPLGLIHRDISPQNVLVTFDGGVKVIDFGIARAAGRTTQTATGIIKGKYAYMSPEQVAGADIDHRTDIFALGVVLHQLLTGKKLFKGADDVQTLAMVAKCEVPPPSEVNPRVPASLDAIALKALAKNPADRYQTALELRLALEDWLSHARLPSSNAHLAAYMQDLYKERLDKERQQGLLWDAPKDGPVSRLGGKVPAGGTPTPTPTPTFSTDMSELMERASAVALPAAPPLPARSKRTIYAVAAVVVILAGGGGTIAIRASKARAQAAAETAALAEEARRAVVTFVTEPASEIAIDGHPMGQTPVREVPLEAGKRIRIEATSEGYDKLDLVEIFSSGRQQKSYTLKKGKVTIVIVSDPGGAKVQLGGLDLGVTPFVWNVEHAETPVELTLVREGFKPAVVQVTPMANGTTTVPLVKAGGPPPKKGGKEAPLIMEGR